MRQSRGLTLDELADVAEVSPSHLSRLERSQTLPSFPVLAKIADALGVDVNDFVRLEHDVAEMDEKLSAIAGLLALDEEARRGLLSLSIEARRDLVARIEQLATLSLTPADVQDQAVRAVDSGDEQAPFSAVRNIIDHAGLDAIGLGRMLLFLDLVEGRRTVLIAGPSLLPITPGQDLMGAYRWAFPGYPIDPPIADWWSRPHGTFTQDGANGRSFRAIITTGALESPPGPIVARSLLAVLAEHESTEIAVSDRSMGDVNLLSVGGDYAVLERIGGRRGSHAANHVAIWLAGMKRVSPFDDAVDQLWGTLSEVERDREIVRDRLRERAAHSG